MKKQKEFRKKLWIVVDKVDGGILQAELDKFNLNIWDGGVEVYADVVFKLNN